MTSAYRRFRRVHSQIICAVFITHASHAAAQDVADRIGVVPDSISKLFKCREITDAEQRLACFDREALAVSTAADAREILIVDKEQIRRERRGLFGLDTSKIKLFGTDSNEPDLEEVSGSVAGSFVTGSGKAMIVLGDGARWVQSDDTPIYKPIEVGEVVSIKSASLGSFIAKIGERRAFRVKRLD